MDTVQTVWTQSSKSCSNPTRPRKSNRWNWKESF